MVKIRTSFNNKIAGIFAAATAITVCRTIQMLLRHCYWAYSVGLFRMTIRACVWRQISICQLVSLAPL